MVLGAKFPDRLIAPASTTKMMTMLLAAEAIARGQVSLDDTVVIPTTGSVDFDFVPGGPQPGDLISLRDLLYLMMLDSDGAATYAVALAIEGSRTAFLASMNARAAQLGLSHTSYVSITGRDPEDFVPGCSGNEFDVPACAHYSTARDLAALARFALDVPLFATIVGRATWTTTAWLRPMATAGHFVPPLEIRRTLTNTNQLIDPSDGDFFPGAYGVKTGTSNRGGSCLVSAANDGAHDVIAVILVSDDNGTATGDRYSDSTTLLDFGLATAP
jgi:D-alanyl-D-alanine carboxypeptidase (penicillin-binding protein 5/6)